MKNDNIKNERKKYSFVQKIAFCLIAIFFFLVFCGSFAGLYLLFKPKKVNADEIIGGGVDESFTSSVIVSLPIEYYLAGGYTRYPNGILPSGFYILQYPLIFSSFTSSSSDSLSLSVSTFSIEYERFSSHILSDSVGFTNAYRMWCPNYDDDIEFSFKCVSSDLVSDKFGTLYSVLCSFIGGTNQPVTFELTDVDGSVLIYEMTPFRAETFGDFELNSLYQFSGRYLYIADSNVNFTERLNQAKEESYNNGYNQGYTEGKDYGYNVGYNQGVNDTDKFTFSSLLNAIFYAPLKAFISIFNFEILGVNVLNIISFFFTMLIAIGIIRWVV